MTDVLLQPEFNAEPRSVRVADGPIDFETWLTVTQGMDTELVKGVMVDRLAAQYPHERLSMWLASILRTYTRNRKLGVVLGSRTAVKINRHDGRLPDILFVREHNTSTIHKDAIYGTPDVVIEIVAPSDSRSDLISLETDYCAIGVPEIVFIDPQKKHVRIVRKAGADAYAASVLTTGRLALDSVPGFWVEIDWIFAESQPDEFEVSSRLIQDAVEGR
jgi:Uma2 family endonuclease